MKYKLFFKENDRFTTWPRFYKIFRLGKRSSLEIKLLRANFIVTPHRYESNFLYKYDFDYCSLLFNDRIIE